MPNRIGWPVPPKSSNRDLLQYQGLEAYGILLRSNRESTRIPGGPKEGPKNDTELEPVPHSLPIMRASQKPGQTMTLPVRGKGRANRPLGSLAPQRVHQSLDDLTILNRYLVIGLQFQNAIQILEGRWIILQNHMKQAAVL